MKKHLLLSALLFLYVSLCIAQSPSEGVKLSVKMKGISNQDGKMMIALYKSETTFLNKPFRVCMGTIANSESMVSFDDIEPGIYAISCYQDKNLNPKLDFNGIGIPQEPTGASNNAKGFFGPPKFKDAKFEIKDKNKNIIINL